MRLDGTRIEVTADYLTDSINSILKDYMRAAQDMYAEKSIKGLDYAVPIARVVLLQEALRFYMFAACKMAGIPQDVDCSLMDLLADNPELGIKYGIGTVKLEGLACIDTGMREAANLTEEDLEWFENSIWGVADNLLKALIRVMESVGIDYPENLTKFIRATVPGPGVFRPEVMSGV